MPNLVTANATPHELHNLLVSVVSFSKKSFVAMGKILRELREEDNFRQAIGSGVDSWDDYLKQPEIGLDSREANRLISIYEEFIIRLGYDEDTVANIPVKNIHYLLPLVKKFETKEEADELIADATFLSQKDFKRRLGDIKVEDGVLTLTYEYMIMRRTNETATMDRVPGITSEMIVQMFNLTTVS